MRREIMSVLIGASILVPADIDAQRVRPRGGPGNGTRVERASDRVQRPGQPAPIRASGRIARSIPATSRRGWRAPDRVVYSSRGGYHGRARSAAFRGRFGRAGFRTQRLWVRADFGRLWMSPLSRHRFGVLYPAELRDILGRRALVMVRDAGRRVGLRGVMRGHWVPDAGVGLVLVVSIDHVDVAEFIDFDRDGFVDEVFVIRNGGWGRVASVW